LPSPTAEGGFSVSRDSRIAGNGPNDGRAWPSRATPPGPMSDLLVPFLYDLRKRKLKVGTQEVVGLAKALSLGLHNHTLDGFYYVARSLMVHRESDLDRFDEAFLAHFRGIETKAQDFLQQLEEWLKDPKMLESLTPEQIAAFQDLSPEEVRKL